MGRLLGIAIGMTAAAVSVASFLNYSNKPDPSTEAQLLMGVGGYVQNYDRNSVRDLTDYVRKTLIMADNDPRLCQDVQCLEQDLYRLGSCASNSQNPRVYLPAIKDLGSMMKCVGERQKRNKGWLWLGGLAGLISLVWLERDIKKINCKPKNF